MASSALRRSSVLAVGSVSKKKCPKIYKHIVSLCLEKQISIYIYIYINVCMWLYMCAYVLTRLYIRTLWSNRDGFCHQNARLAFYSNSLRVIREGCKTCLALQSPFNSSTYAKGQLRNPFSHDNWWGVSCRFPACRSDLTWRRILTGSKATTFQLWRSTCHGWVGRERVVYANKQQTWLVNSSKNITKSNMFKYVPMWFRKCHNTVSYAATSGLNLVSSKWHCKQNDVL